MYVCIFVSICCVAFCVCPFAIILWLLCTMSLKSRAPRDRSAKGW